MNTPVLTPLFPIPGAHIGPCMDEHGGIHETLEGPAFRPAPASRPPATRTTPLRGEPLPSPVDLRASIRVQQAENRELFRASCLMLVLGIALLIPSAAALLVPLIGGK